MKSSFLISYQLQVFLYLAILVTPHIVNSQERPGTHVEYVEHGNRLFKQGDFRGARSAFRDALRMDGNLPAAYLGLALIDIEENDWNDAIDNLGRTIERDPESVAAFYYRGIAYRELAKFRTFNEVNHWRRSDSDFQEVVRRDSLFEDVLYQYALWFRYRDEYEKAIQLGHRQIDLKPELSNVQQGLFSLYRYFINHTGKAEVQSWLQAHPTGHAAYFWGETLRKQGALDAAETVFESLLSSPITLPKQPILLSRVRIHFARQQFETAQAFFERAVQEIEGPLEAYFLFEDAKYILDDAELDLYRSLTTSEEYIAFFRSIWERRDPMPARAVNMRLAEHYRRLVKAEKEYAYDGFRLWHNDPDRRGELDFPEVYTLNQEFNDKGLIFIRHGEPDESEWQVGDDMDFRTIRNNLDVYGTPREISYGSGWSANESWRYYRPQRMDFHFVVAEGGNPDCWRLIPELLNLGMLESREHWGAPYSEMAAAARALEAIQGSKTIDAAASNPVVIALDEEVSEEIAQARDSLIASPSSQLTLQLMDENSRRYMEFSSVRDRMVEQSREAISLALSTDQHTWEESVEQLDMPYQLATFRGPDGATTVDIYFALPIGRITEKIAPNKNNMDVEMGYSVRDLDWGSVSDTVETKRLPASPDESTAVIDFFRFEVQPDSYRVAIHGRPVETNQLGGYSFDYRIPDYSASTLAMSDLLLADYIGPAQSGSRFDRGDLHITPNPFHRFSVLQPVFVYFEVYNLTYSADDLTTFTIEYTLKPQRARRRVLGIFGRSDQPSLSLSMERTGDTVSPIEHVEIDVKSVDPGDYTLTITITDTVTGQVSERSVPLTLYRKEPPLN